jgi:hypothetical protein
MNKSKWHNKVVKIITIICIILAIFANGAAEIRWINVAILAAVIVTWEDER